MSVVILVWADIDDGKGGVSAGGMRKKYVEYIFRVCYFKDQFLKFQEKVDWLVICWR